MAKVQPKKRSVDYKCQDCGMVVTVKDLPRTAQNGELMCCNQPMKQSP